MLSAKPTLRVDCSRDRTSRIGKGSEELVADAVDDPPAVRGDRGADQRAVRLEQIPYPGPSRSSRSVEPSTSLNREGEVVCSRVRHRS